MPPKGRKNSNSLAKRAYKIARSLQKSVEKKMYQLNTTQTALTTGAVFPLSSIPEGVGSLARDGLKVLPKSIYARIRINHGDDGGTPPILDPRGVLTRVVIFRDTQQDPDTTPVVSDLFESTPYVTSSYDRLHRARYKILLDRTYTTAPNASNSVLFKKHFLRGKKVEVPIWYNGGGSTDIQKNGLYILFVTDDAVYSPTYQLQVRMMYTDL